MFLGRVSWRRPFAPSIFRVLEGKEEYEGYDPGGYGGVGHVEGRPVVGSHVEVEEVDDGRPHGQERHPGPAHGVRRRLTDEELLLCL